MNLSLARPAAATAPGRRRAGIRLALMTVPTGVAMAATVLAAVPAHADVPWNAYALSGPGGCLDVQGGSTVNFTPVQSFTCNATTAQIWTAETGSTLLALGKCLDVQYGGTADGTPVDLYDCNGTGAQVWIPQSNGSFYNPQSNKCLDDTNWATGVQAQIWDCDGNANQAWMQALQLKEGHLLG